MINKDEKVACEAIEGINITRPSYNCSLHKRCISGYNPKRKLLQQWKDRYESRLFQLCLQCPDYCSSPNENSEK